MDVKAQIESIKESLREQFQSMAKLYPEFSDFILRDCMPESIKSVFDLVESSSKAPWFPYLKVSGGSDHERAGEFFYTRPAWKGTEDDVKYRYLGREITAYVVGRSIYQVEYDTEKKRIVGRYLPKGIRVGNLSKLYTVRVVYLAADVPDLGGKGIFALEGVRSKISTVSKIWEAVGQEPVKVTLRAKKESGNSGAYWGMEVVNIEPASWDVLPFAELVGSLRDYYEKNLKLRELMVFTEGVVESEESEGEELETASSEAQFSADVSEAPVAQRSSGRKRSGSIFEDEDDEVPF